MESIDIKAKPREVTGKKATKQLRKAKQVPCVLYGGEEVKHFSAPATAFKDLVYTANIYTVNLTINDAKHRAILKDIDFHPVTDEILHIDFQELVQRPIKLELPVRFVGTPKSVEEGGIPVPKLRKLKVKGRPSQLPDHIEVNVENLEIGDTVKVGDIETKDITLLSPDRLTLFIVAAPRDLEELESTAEVADEEAVEGEEGEEVAEGEAAEEGEEGAEAKAEGEGGDEKKGGEAKKGGEEKKGDDAGDKKEEG